MKKKSNLNLEWLYNSMNAVNGVGYADKSNPTAYAESYVKFKIYRKKPNEAKYALENWQDTLKFAEHLCESKDGLKPNPVNYSRFLEFSNNIDINKLHITDNYHLL